MTIIRFVMGEFVAPCVCTVTVLAAVVVAPLLEVAVKTYCVVEVGETVVEPEADTIPIP
jgi:hypothetical protein